MIKNRVQLNLEIFKVKIINSRNLIFLLLIVCIHIGFFVAANLYGLEENLISGISRINHKTFYLWILVGISSQLDSGLYAKQLTNGLSRRKLALNELTYSIYKSILYYGLTICLLYPIQLMHPNIDLGFSRLIGFPILGFIGLAFIAMFIGLIIKNPIKSAVAGYFIIDFEGIPAVLLSKYTNPNWSLVFPHHVSMSLVDFSNEPIYGAKIFAVVCFTLLFSRLCYKRMLYMNYN